MLLVLFGDFTERREIPNSTRAHFLSAVRLGWSELGISLIFSRKKEARQPVANGLYQRGATSAYFAEIASMRCVMKLDARFTSIRTVLMN